MYFLLQVVVRKVEKTLIPMPFLSLRNSCLTAEGGRLCTNTWTRPLPVLGVKAVRGASCRSGRKGSWRERTQNEGESKAWRTGLLARGAGEGTGLAGCPGEGGCGWNPSWKHECHGLSLAMLWALMEASLPPSCLKEALLDRAVSVASPPGVAALHPPDMTRHLHPCEWGWAPGHS